VLSVKEVTLLLRAATAPKYKVAFATAGACPRAALRADPWGLTPRDAGRGLSLEHDPKSLNRKVIFMSLVL